ncbi:rhamnose ABC transporter substrate-binding protein [Deinococcus sp. KSM4-11]|uniref:rhamnose ABC transporter substrate-binding protein n=1 Tax=Deinococcus sp. KSM4-11 TaxID=2568654 RepID=UPI0010A4CA01|nr:rhamnose ABC transporter substrate-binding protein [Deinococcus sp. KSM4-11]THF86076.1 rhamnose ABC transporter substrate-binding protein [Deinococcus sp. KSM4-11]
MKSRSLLLSALALGSVATLAYAQTPALKKGLKITLLPKNINNPYNVIETSGGTEAGKEIEANVKIVGPSDAGASSQVSYINTAIAQKQDALVLAANDANALLPYLARAKASGMKIVTMDSDTAVSGRTLFINQANSEGIGRAQVQLVGKLIGYKGDIAVLSATPNATNQNTWIKWMQEELKLPKYKDMKLVKIAYGNDDDQKSFTEMQGLIQAYPNLKGVISPTTVGISAGARYLSTSPQKGKVMLTGLGTPNQMRAFVKDGTVTAFQLWNPADVGYLATYAAAALVSGQITGKEGEKFKAGKLGEYTIGKNGEIIVGPPYTFDKANIDKFDF